MHVDNTHRSQSIDLSLDLSYITCTSYLRSRNLLPTSDSQAPLISTLLTHMSIIGPLAFRIVSSYSLCA